MELRQAEAFVAVAEELHFGRAAARLHIAQPPLSQTIRKLEAELGVALLRRTTRRVEVLPAGDAFLVRAREMLATADSAADEARAAAAGELGRLALGFTGSMTYALLPVLAKALRAQLPRVRVELHGELLTPQQVERLRAGTLDVALLRPPVVHADLRVEPVGAEALIVALPAGHRLARLERVPVAELASEPFVAYPSHFRSVVHDSVEATCAANGFVPIVAMEVGETSTMISFVAADVGVALVPASAGLMTVQGAVYRPLSGASQSVQLAMCWREGNPTPTLEPALEVIRSELAALREGRSRFGTTGPAASTLSRTLY